MATFYVTFGSGHHREAPRAHHDGWWTVIAADELAARRAVIDVIGRRWSSIYPDGPRWDPAYYPLGELHRIEAVGVR